MAFAKVQEALDFLDRYPDIELFELFILDANGVPRGKLLHREELLPVYESGRPCQALLWACLLTATMSKIRAWCGMSVMLIAVPTH